MSQIEPNKKKRIVTLVLEYELGDYSDMEEEGQTIPLDPAQWEETFYQADVLICDMKIVNVKIK